MAKILELRETLISLYGRFEMYVKPGVRFVVALVVFLLINGFLGYMHPLNSPVIALVLALICTFLPGGATMVLGAGLIATHLFALCLEAGIVALLLFLLMFFLYFKYAPKNSYAALMMPVLCYIRMPEIMPTVLGLNRGPYSVLSMACGLMTYYFLQGVRENEAILSAPTEEQELSGFTVVLQPLVENRELLLMVGAFLVATIAIYIIRRQSFPHAWTIAIGAGNGLNLIILIIGSVLIEKTGQIPWMVLGTIVAVLVGLLMEFFMFHLDYARTERIQFFDDEYYYYVKAIPKVYVSNTKKRVKEISGRKNPGISKKELADEFEISQDLLDD